MFKRLLAAFVCVGVQWSNDIFSFNSFRLLAVLLLLFQVPAIAAPPSPPPAWTVPLQQTSDDGYALLSWERTGDDAGGFFKITESFEGEVTVHYTEATELRAWRVEPGAYGFVLQQCVKKKSGVPDCGRTSDQLTLLVSETLASALLTKEPPETTLSASGNQVSGGPDQLQPGHWYNPAKSGHGWNFYWSNRLALPQSDAMFGNNYDLVGLWYTYEAKYAISDPSCNSCPPLKGAYRPVVIRLKAVSLGADSYAGSLYVSRGDGTEDWVGNAQVSFGADNNSASIYWRANFKKEKLVDTDPLVFLLGSDPDNATNISHFSGLWQHDGDDRYLVATNIGDVAEIVTVVFQDDADDPTWLQAINYGAAAAGTSNFCLGYQLEGYSPKTSKPHGWTQDWYMSGCDPEQPARTSNRNGKRYFPGLDKQYFWADFSLPGTNYANGSISIGSSAAPVALEKTASFHGVFYNSADGSACALTGTNPVCDLQLTWYTDGNYPSATVYAHNLSNNTYDKVMTSSQPSMVDVPYHIATAGQYEFELHMGNGQQTTLMARSAVFSVTASTPGARPETPPAPASPPAMSASSSSSKIGVTQAAFRVNESGSATYNIPILTAPASGGFAPRVSLDYNSQSGNGEAGVGWSIGGVSAITLCPQTIEQDGISGSRGLRLDGSDRFCIDGQRLVVDPASGSYGNDGSRYRTEIDSFARITAHGSAGNGPAWFRVEHKDGTVVDYGNSADSRIEARGAVTPATVLTWAQNRSQDRSGNYVLFSYLENSAGPVAYVLKTIDYTGNARAGTAPNARLTFSYRERTADEDLTYRYFAGVEVEQRQLLQGISSQARIDTGGALEDLRFYALGYETDGVGRNILTKLTECRSVSRTICYPSTQFAWLKSESTIDTSATTLSGLLPKSKLSGLLLADVTGDGRPDLLYTKHVNHNYILYVKKATASAGFTDWATSYKLPKKADGKPPRLMAIDLNTDGIQDVIYSKYSKTTDDYSWVALISNGSGFSTELQLNSGHRFYLNDQALESRFQVMDFNGDGKSDVLHAYTDLEGRTWNLTVLLNNTAAGGNPSLSAPIDVDVTNTDLFPFDISGDWGIDIKPPLYDWSAVGSEEHEIPAARIFDFNGDGAVDLLLKVWRNYRHCVANCLPPLSATVTGSPSGGGSTREPVYEYRFVSFWVLMESNGHDAFTRHRIVALGDDCTLGVVCQDVKYDDLPVSDYVWPVDINADGLADIAWGDRRGTWYSQINTGNGFAAAEQIGQVPDGVNKLARMEDWNGDSYPDLVYPSAVLQANARWMVSQNHFGRMFAASANTGVPAGNVGGDADYDPVENDTSVFADFDGDGKRDQLMIGYNRYGEIDSTMLRRGRNVSGSRAVEPANVITSITNGFGATTEIAYKPLTDPGVYSRMHDSSNAQWGRGAAVYDLIAPIYVVGQVLGSAPVYGDPSARSQVQYHYVGAKLQAGGRGFLGFAEVISYDPQTHIRTNSRYRQDFPFVGMLVDTTRVSNAAGSKFASISNTAATEPNNWDDVSISTAFPSGAGGTPLSYVLNQWEYRATAGDAVFPYISDSTRLAYTLNGVFEHRQLTSSSHDAYGNATRVSVSTYDTQGGAAFARETTVNTWSIDTNGWNIGQLSSTSVTFSRTGTPSISRVTSFAYDPVTGVLNREITEPGSNVFRVTTDYGLDTFGNRRQTTVTGVGMTARKTVEKYDNLGRFVNESVNALNQTTMKVMSRDVFGNPLEVENIDGVVTISAADHMGVAFVSYTETGAWTKTFNYSGRGSRCPVDTVYRSVVSSGGGASQTQCFDLLGRVLRTAVKGLDGVYVYTDQYYDSSGRVSRKSEPYFAGDSRYWNITGYDDLGRITGVLSAGGDDMAQDYDNRAINKCITAAPRVSVVIDGLNQQRIEVKNVKGETTAVYDDRCRLVSYDYDALGNLKKVSGADGVTVAMSYDIAGRKISMNDPDKGYWRYAYNPLGEMIRQLDARQQAVDFTYDALGRITNRRELTGVSNLTDTVFTTVNRESTTYLTGSPGKGQVASITYRMGESGVVLHRQAFTYDSFGRSDLATTTVAAEQFVRQTTYDQYSRVFQQFDASGDDRGIRYVYSNGYVSKLKEAREGLQGTVYQDIQAMDARGNVTALRLGNGVDVYANFEPESGRLIKQSAYDASGAELMDVDYLFNVLGSLRQRHDTSASTDLKEVFSYDTLNRLKSVDLSRPSGAPVRTLSMDYDAAGNIIYKSDVGTYQYNGLHPHAVSSAGGTTYSYDANGNQVSGGGRNISYTVFDKPATITRGSNRTEFSYGVGNNRYQRKDYEGGVLQKSTLYLGGVERITENGSTFFKRYLGGVAIATFYPASSTQQLSYLLKDHIGSIHSVLNESGLITANMHFNAFGERQGSDWKTPLTGFLYAPLNAITTQGFTGHEQVDPVGIIHMNGRIYDPKLGRFLQADPIGAGARQ